MVAPYAVARLLVQRREARAGAPPANGGRELHYRFAPRTCRGGGIGVPYPTENGGRLHLSVTVPPPRRSARKAKGDGHLRRAEILEAAERIFVAEGYEGATIRKIADEVGVSSTALYMHFQDKGCILLEICERTLRLLFERNSEIAAKPLDAVVRVKLMLEAYMRWGMEHPNAYQLVYCGLPLSMAGIGKWPQDDLNIPPPCYATIR